MDGERVGGMESEWTGRGWEEWSQSGRGEGGRNGVRVDGERVGGMESE